MFIPVPALVAAGLVFLALLVVAMRSTRTRDPLLGGQLPARRATRPAPMATLPAEAETEVRALLAAGRKIDAIKLTRDTTRLGLKQAKDLVESME